MRMLFTTNGLSGHFFPLVPLAWAARVAGHDVLVVSSDSFVATVTRAGLPAASYGPVGEFVELASREPGFRTLAERRYAHGRVFGRLAAGGLPGMMSLVDSWRPDLVVSERAEFAGPVAASARGIPQVEVHWGVGALAEYRTAAAVELRGPLSALGMTTLPRPDWTLDPWPPSLRLPHAAGHQSMRYLPYNGETTVPEWMLARRDVPRVCVTLGTVVPHLGRGEAVDSLLGMIEELAVLDVELVIAVDDAIAATWPPLPDAVRYAGRMAMSQVLGACEASVNHGGQGTVLTALQAGCPQLVLPVFDDQFDNGEAAVRAGAGVLMSPEEVTPRAVARRCAELLEHGGYRAAVAGVAEEIGAQTPPIEIVDMLADLVVSGVARPDAA